VVQGRVLNRLIVAVVELNQELAHLLDTVDMLAVVLDSHRLAGRVSLGRILGKLDGASVALLNHLTALALLVEPLVGVRNRLRDDELVDLLEHIEVGLHLRVGLVILEIELNLELLVTFVILEVKGQSHTRPLNADALIPIVVEVNGRAVVELLRVANAQLRNIKRGSRNNGHL